MSDQPQVSVVVVAYNGERYIASLLDSLAADRTSPPFEVLVIDNASTDATAAAVAARAASHPKVHLERSPVNLGYAGGVNLALGISKAPYVAVINQDCVVTPGWLTAPIAALEQDTTIGAATGLMLLADSDRINAAGQDVHITGLGFNRRLRRPATEAGTKPERVSGIHGGSLFIRRELLDEMGGWDDSGFLYHEDVDLSWLLILMGYELLFVPASVIRHDYHLTMYPEKLYLLERNRLAMLLTHLRPLTRIMLIPILALTELMMWGYCAMRGRDFLRAKTSSYSWLLTHRGDLAARRAHVDRLRVRSDWAVVRRARWNYNWDQFLTLGRERTPSIRRPGGDLPDQMRH
jgi:GT2 family glycosyltransferase